MHDQLSDGRCVERRQAKPDGVVRITGGEFFQTDVECFTQYLKNFLNVQSVKGDVIYVAPLLRFDECAHE